MKIVDADYTWNGILSKRNITEYIVLHHRAGFGDSLSIHKDHLSKGWSGIGYHFYVRKDGTVYRGRPIATVGAHCIGYNNKSIGVCFEGNWETDSNMPSRQIRTGKALVTYLLKLYPKAKVLKHCDLGKTACPGKNFPFDEIKKGEREMTVEEAVQIVQAKAGLEDETIDFLLCYKYGESLIIKLAGAME